VLGRNERRLRFADPRGEGRRERRGRVEVPPAAQHRRGVLDREEELDDVRPAGDRVQPELELGHDPEVAAAAAQPPEQLGVVGLVNVVPVAFGRDQLVRRHVVARQAVPAREPAHPAAERQPADSGMGHVARGRGQSMLHRGAVERAEQSPTLHPGATALRIDDNAAHRGQVDHEAALRHAEAEHAVPAAPHPDLEVAVSGVADRLGHVVRARAADYRARAPIDHGVPHGPRFVVSRRAVPEEAVVNDSTHRARLSAPLPASTTGSPPRPTYGRPHQRADDCRIDTQLV
jgi:hypothetical protein